MMNIALSDDLERLLTKKVKNGQFPNEEAVVEQALRRFADDGQPILSPIGRPWGFDAPEM
jgi:Arc/MetJ-type ribon-helix-helix transcriptional regulator